VRRCSPPLQAHSPRSVHSAGWEGGPLLDTLGWPVPPGAAGLCQHLGLRDAPPCCAQPPARGQAPLAQASHTPHPSPPPPLPCAPLSRHPVRGLCLLTAKPMVYAANVAEDDLAAPEANRHVTALRAKAAEEGSDVVVVSAQVNGQYGWLGRAAAERGGRTAQLARTRRLCCLASTLPELPCAASGGGRAERAGGGGSCRVPGGPGGGGGRPQVAHQVGCRCRPAAAPQFGLRGS
jgi:hypothetical protein